MKFITCRRMFLIEESALGLGLLCLLLMLCMFDVVATFTSGSMRLPVVSPRSLLRPSLTRQARSDFLWQASKGSQSASKVSCGKLVKAASKLGKFLVAS